ncbi:MAG: hypothetical protein ACRECW_20670, partial [Phyllobacterium sp.]
YVDYGILEQFDHSVLLVCSTEYFVLRCANDQSIAFLVPFLLSDPVQAILAASQEGGHHPRFGQRVLETIPVPAWLAAHRDEISVAVENAITQARQADWDLRATIQLCSRPIED